MDNLSTDYKNYRVVATWNANGLIRGKDELEVFLEDREVAVMLVSETRLKPGQYFGLRNYQVFRKDRDSRGGGVAVLVRKNLQARQVEVVSTIEAIGAEVELRGKRQTFVAVYNPPKNRMTAEDIGNLLLGPRTLVGGDLNAKNTSWGCRRTNPNGRILGEVVRKTKGVEVFAPTVATSVPVAENCRGDVIDIFLAFKMADPWEVRTEYALDSDHFPVVAKIGGDPLKARVRRRVDWLRLREKSEEIGIGKASAERGKLSDLASEFAREVQEVVKGCTTEVPIKKWNFLGLTKEEKETIRQKNMAKKEWNKWRRDEDRRKYRGLEREVKNLVLEARRRQILNQVEEANQETGNCWQVLRALGRGGRPTDAPIRDNGRFVFADKEKAEVAASFLETVFQNNRSTEKKLQRRADNWWDGIQSSQSTEEQEERPVVSVERIVGIIKLKKKTSAPGEDGITYKILGGLHIKALERLRDLFEASVRLGEVPKCWKTGSIVLIPKGDKDPGQVENRRPISLINCIAKVLETLVKEEIQEFVEENSVFPETQFGFRAGLSATHQAAHLVETIAAHNRPRKRSVVALFDLEKAYDKVWRSGLVAKLVEQKFPSWCVRWVVDWLSERQFRVEMGSEASGWRRAPEGLPQGSPLSPSLFNIFVSDLPRAVTVKGTFVFQFADDTAILAVGASEASTINKIEAASAQLLRYFERWKMSANTNKTEVMLLGKKTAKQEVVRIGKSKVRMKRSVRYLGVEIDRRLTFEGHVKRRAGLAKLRLRKLGSVVKPESGVDLATRVKILKMIAQPSAFYGKELAIRGSAKTRERLAITQRVLIRRCLGAPWYVPNRMLWEAAGVVNIGEVAERSREALVESFTKHREEGIRRVAELCRK